jgi:hypothetical protein
LKITSMFVVVLLLSGVSARAQEIAGSFDQLRVLVKSGDTLTITDTSGQRVQGKLTQLSGSGLVLDVSGAVRQFQDSDVNTVEKRGPDSLKNGALTGFAIGGGLGGIAIGALAASDDGPTAAVAVVAALLYGGMGAGIGVGIDALIEGRRVIYARSNAPGSRITVAPLLSARRRGVIVSFRLAR